MADEPHVSVTCAAWGSREDADQNTGQATRVSGLPLGAPSLKISREASHDKHPSCIKL